MNGRFAHFLYILGMLIIACTLLGACTWVQPLDEAREISLVKSDVVQDCKKISVTTVKVLHKVGFLRRGEATVQDELVTMAKNDAALVRGDVIVAETAVEEGRQRFGIYRCSSQ